MRTLLRARVRCHINQEFNGIHVPRLHVSTEYLFSAKRMACLLLLVVTTRLTARAYYGGSDEPNPLA
jgi:hypothetical protein